MTKLLIALILSLGFSVFVAAEEPLVITATRISEDAAKVPAAVTVISGAELRDRGVSDLRGALALAGGVDIVPGGDGGPASSVPEFYGLKEFDAYLLVVDGVPWGGAFTPAPASVSFSDVERIEVIRGAAPVMYGATSFVGVISVIHKASAKVERSLRAGMSSYGSKALDASVPLPSVGGLQSVLSVDVERQGFRDPRTSFFRDRLDWRGEAATAWGKLKLAAAGVFLRQKPASPFLREGLVLSSKTPLDANYNPLDAYLDEDRLSVSAGLERESGAATWSSLLAYSHSSQRVLRGFLDDITVVPDAAGFRQDLGLTDLYLDTHVQWLPAGDWKVVGGLDHLHGKGSGRGGAFNYFVDLAGAAPPGGGSLASTTDATISDQRDFSGLYGFTEWEPVSRLVVEGGLRLNRIEEARRKSSRALGSGVLTSESDRTSYFHGSGAAGVTWKAWERGGHRINVFGAYSNSFKPAAPDFGLSSQPGVLAPETAESYTGGLKTRWFDRLDVDASVFHMDFRNVLIAATVGGLPVKQNGGKTRFQGFEAELSAGVCEDLRWQGAYSYHDARFGDFVQVFGATPTQLQGKRMETSARHMASSGLTYAPAQGVLAAISGSYVGDRFLDKRNRALASPYATWSAGLGYRAKSWQVRLDGVNLNDQRPPTAESELGDAQYYLLPARRIGLSTSWMF